MKQTLFIIALFASTLLANATVRTVNNNNPTPGQYSTVAAAITAASSGDTLLLAGSPYNYNTITLTKPLTLIGSGHKPLSQSSARTFCDYIYLNSGSSGSNIIGIDVLNDLTDNYTSSPGINNILVSRCKIGFRLILAQYAANWTIESCIFTYAGSASTQGSNYGNVWGQDHYYVHDITMRNNIFNGFIGDLGNYYSWAYNIYLQHNIFLTNNYYCREFAELTCYVNDNIFYRTRPKSYSGTGTIYYSNNISYQTAANDTLFPNGTNFVNDNPQFVNFPNAGATYSDSYDFNLQSTSIGKNAATDATDIGVYGGTAIFNQNGIPTVPYIKTLQITGSNTVPANGTLNISVTGKVVR
ncbi:MAG: hypothetical protein RIQ33_2543 [Bacteroidota bacterium]|jgi:hypothetical protein